MGTDNTRTHMRLRLKSILLPFYVWRDHNLQKSVRLQSIQELLFDMRLEILFSVCGAQLISLGEQKFVYSLCQQRAISLSSRTDRVI